MTKCPFCGYTPEHDVVLWGAVIKSVDGRYNSFVTSTDKEYVKEVAKTMAVQYKKTVHVMKETDREAKNEWLSRTNESK